MCPLEELLVLFSFSIVIDLFDNTHNSLKKRKLIDPLRFTNPVVIVYLGHLHNILVLNDYYYIRWICIPSYFWQQQKKHVFHKKNKDNVFFKGNCLNISINFEISILVMLISKCVCWCLPGIPTCYFNLGSENGDKSLQSCWKQNFETCRLTIWGSEISIKINKSYQHAAFYV